MPAARQLLPTPRTALFLLHQLPPNHRLVRPVLPRRVILLRLLLPPPPLLRLGLCLLPRILRQLRLLGWLFKVVLLLHWRWDWEWFCKLSNGGDSLDLRYLLDL